MRYASWLILVGGLWGLAAGSVRGQEPLQWQANLEAAQRLAGQTNRLVLIHFWAPWCKPCLQMEQTVFSQPEVAAALEPHFVLVKLNADDWKATARMYGVASLPTDVVITPTGRLVAAIQSPPTAAQYVAKMNNALQGHQQLNQSPYANLVRQSNAQNPYGAVAAGPGAPPPQTAQAATVPPTAQSTAGEYAAGQYTGGQDFAGQYPAGQSNGARYSAGSPPAGQYAGAAAVPSSAAPTADPTGRSSGQLPAAGVSNPGAPQYAASSGQSAGYGAPPAAAATVAARPGASIVPPAGPRATPAVAQSPSRAPVGLDAFCPVTLAEQKKWAQGDPRWGAIHLGRTYLFSSQEAQRRFLANPDAYSPVMQGNDPVLALDNGQAVPGTREHGVFFEQRVYLFSSEDSVKRFQQNPKRYAAEVVQARR